MELIGQSIIYNTRHSHTFEHDKYVTYSHGFFGGTLHVLYSIVEVTCSVSQFKLFYGSASVCVLKTDLSDVVHDSNSSSLVNKGEVEGHGNVSQE